MTENRDRLSRRRGRCILFFEIFAICFILFLTYTHKPTVTIQNSQFWIEDGRTFIETPISNAKTIKETLLSSSWIHLFPSVRHMVTQIDENVISHITNAKQTTITLKGGNKFVVGNKLTAKIVAKDQLGRQKNYGGDFFIVTLRRLGYQNDVITCDVFDEMMGIYHVSCLLPWPGIAYLNAVLVHPSESIFQMIKKYSSEHEWGVLMNTTMRNSKNIDEYTPCSVGFPEKSPSELCDYSNPSHGEKWTCIKPESGECSSITWQEKKTLEQIQFFDKTHFKRGLNLYAKITGSGTNISIAESSENFKYLDENLYKTNENPFKSTGWFDNGRWISTVVPGEVSYSVERLQQCTTNKNFYFIGDSTIRQWHEHFAKTLGIKQYGPDNSVAWSQHRDGSSESMNTTLHYRSHGSPLHNPGPVSSRPYISDSLDSITNAGEGTYVFITLGLHFELYDADIFGDRIRIIKSAVKSLLLRSHGVKIFIKGHNHHGYSKLCPSAWLSYRYDVMLRHEFKDIADVTYLSLWDLSIAADNRVLHPENNLLKTQIALFLSYIC